MSSGSHAVSMQTYSSDVPTQMAGLCSKCAV
jgi:hypothetical protein